MVLRLHHKYGDFVRIGPNHVSINNPAAIQQVYGHKTGFTKGPFYDAFLQVTPVVFNTRNVSEHARKRKYINPAFSSRALSDFEPYMDAEVLGWKRQLLRVSQKGDGRIDFAAWSECTRINRERPKQRVESATNIAQPITLPSMSSPASRSVPHSDSLKREGMIWASSISSTRVASL